MKNGHNNKQNSIIMKARIKETGEIMNISDYSTVILDVCGRNGNLIELGINDIEILQDETTKDKINYEERTWEIFRSFIEEYYKTCDPSNELLKTLFSDATKIVETYKKLSENQKTNKE